MYRHTWSCQRILKQAQTVSRHLPNKDTEIALNTMPQLQLQNEHLDPVAVCSGVCPACAKFRVKPQFHKQQQHFSPFFFLSLFFFFLFYILGLGLKPEARRLLDKHFVIEFHSQPPKIHSIIAS